MVEVVVRVRVLSTVVSVCVLVATVARVVATAVVGVVRLGGVGAGVADVVGFLT